MNLRWLLWGRYVLRRGPTHVRLYGVAGRSWFVGLWLALPRDRDRPKTGRPNPQA